MPGSQRPRALVSALMVLRPAPGSAWVESRGFHVESGRKKPPAQRLLRASPEMTHVTPLGKLGASQTASLMRQPGPTGSKPCTCWKSGSNTFVSAQRWPRDVIQAGRPFSKVPLSCSQSPGSFENFWAMQVSVVHFPTITRSHWEPPSISAPLVINISCSAKDLAPQCVLHGQQPWLLMPAKGWKYRISGPTQTH